MRIPQVKDIDTALQIYYKYKEIGSTEIASLFEDCSKSTISKLKKAAQQRMIDEEVCTYSSNRVNTAIAFSSWGIDIDDLEKRRDKLIELGLK